jgi:hypothetical protein
MDAQSTFTGEQLAGSLQALGVQFIMGKSSIDKILHKHPAHLIAALAESNESRLRLSIIPLFLEHPEFAAQVRGAANQVDPARRLMLQCYYTAAVWLQRKYSSRIDLLIGRKESLPDYFSSGLGIQTTDDPTITLQRLAERHRELSGAQVNWLGTYEHAAEVWIKGLEIQKT